MAEMVTISLTTWNEAERNAVRELTAKRLLSHTVSVALHEYLQRVNPALNTNVEQSTRVWYMRDEAEVDLYLLDVHKASPATPPWELKQIKNGLMRRLKEGDLEMNTKTGIMIVKPRSETPAPPAPEQKT